MKTITLLHKSHQVGEMPTPSKPLAIFYQEYDLNRTDGELEYYQAMVRVLEERSQQGHEELERLKERRK